MSPSILGGGGVVATLLFTDIVGSTAMLARLGNVAWRGLLLDHNNAMRDALNRHRGRELKTTGDGFVAAFDSATRAVRCARRWSVLRLSWASNPGRLSHG